MCRIPCKQADYWGCLCLVRAFRVKHLLICKHLVFASGEMFPRWALFLVIWMSSGWISFSNTDNTTSCLPEIRAAIQPCPFSAAAAVHVAQCFYLSLTVWEVFNSIPILATSTQITVPFLKCHLSAACQYNPEERLTGSNIKSRVCCSVCVCFFKFDERVDLFYLKIFQRNEHTQNKKKMAVM